MSQIGGQTQSGDQTENDDQSQDDDQTHDDDQIQDDDQIHDDDQIQDDYRTLDDDQIHDDDQIQDDYRTLDDDQIQDDDRTLDDDQIHDDDQTQDDFMDVDDDYVDVVGSRDVMYEALRNEDLGDCVVLAAQIVQGNELIRLEQTVKSSPDANLFVSHGKRAFYERGYQFALVSYNMALMHAPHNSEAMTHCYYYRAELLFGAKQFDACVKDINTCLTLDCDAILINKLKEMKAEASRYTCMERVLSVDESCSQFVEEFFTLKGSRNSDIPCATSDVEVIMQSGQPKVVAAKDIPVGTVVAVETAFAAVPCLMNSTTSCYYCLKLDFNLMPCEECCDALFCDKKCKDKALQEGHNFECKIVGFVPEPMRLPLRATIKMRQLCSSWDEFITASNTLGVERMKNSTVADIFGSQKFSLLNFQYDTHFIYGAMANICTYFAHVINYFNTFTSFLPNSPDEKRAAIQAMSRILMHLSLYCTEVQLQHSTKKCIERCITSNSHINIGYFPFIGSLSNSCLPNSYVMGLRNSAALVTIASIKKGDELTISYIGHWLQNRQELIMRAKKIFINYRIVCEDCVICCARADDIFLDTVLNKAQMKVFRKFSNHFTSSMRNCYQSFHLDYRESCNVLQALSDMPCAKEYDCGFETFIRCIMYLAQENFPNVTMSTYI